MIQRPKPSDSESDLLREQEEFLSSGGRPAANVARRPEKRRGDEADGDGGEPQENQRDVVTITDLPDDLPALTPASAAAPAPPKKSRFKKERVRFEDEDPEELLDKHDTHISAVLSRIVERDTSSVPVSFPTFTTTAFPKVLHRSTAETQGKTPGGRKSIFARQIAAQNAKEGRGNSKNDPKIIIPQRSGSTRDASGAAAAPGSLLVSGQGLGPDSAAETLRIHQENQARLENMSQSEIVDEQKKLLAQLDPRLVDFVRSRKSQKASSSGPSRLQSPDQLITKGKPAEPEPESQDVVMDADEEEGETQPEAQPPIREEDLPVRPQKEWVHMDKLEPEKLEWTRDLPAPRKQSTKQAMQARFDFSGSVIPPTQDLPTHLGLHHHGEEPELAGYSLQELFLLSRSQLTQQRTLALNTLAQILSKARAGVYCNTLKGSVLSSLLDAGLIFLLRFSLDDGVESVMSAAVHALRALLVSPDDEECLDRMFPWLMGMAAFPLLPSGQEEEEEDDEGLDESMKLTAKEKELRKPDHDVARVDVIKGLLKMQVLQRLRYILEVVRPAPGVVLDVLEILIRIARHSASAATQILDCPRLMETVMSEFLPCSWAPPTSPAPPSLYGLPVSAAMKLLRVLASAGRHTCSRILNSLGGRERLSRFLAAEPQELLLEPGEAFLCSTEALRLWAVAASYGQACSLYTDLYSVLVKALQAAHKPITSSEPLLLLELHRVQALLLLLTQVTHTAGCHQELQSALLNSQGTESLPPPPVTWSQVTGLQPTVIGLLKGCVMTLDDPSQRSRTLTLLPSYLIYLGAFYSQLSLQSSFQPVQCLQELESLTSDVLLPLISNQAVISTAQNLRCSSVICRSVSDAPGPDLVSSLPGLGCVRLKMNPSLAGPGSPLALCSALFYLLDVLTSLHRGLTQRFSSLLLSESVLGYLKSCVGSMPSVSHASAWILRHEHLLLYLLLRLAHRLVPVDAEIAKHAALFHQVALALLPWLLPGSEYLAHELLSTIIFNQELFPEGGGAGPEAASLSELDLQENSTPPSGLGPLLRLSLSHLPSIRGCYLTFLSHLEPAVLSSRDRHLGRTPWLTSQLLPELSGPSLPSDWPFLPLISLYERTGVCEGRGQQVGSVPAGALQAVVQCLQWLLLVESWRGRALSAVPPGAKLARLSCVFLCSTDLFLERPVQDLTWALFRRLTGPTCLQDLDLGTPPPGLASFHDLYSALLVQYEAVSFGDPLFVCFVLLPLQRRYSATMRLAVFGEHVGILRSLGVSLQQLPFPLENFTSPPEDSLPLLRLYFRALVTGALRRSWCPVLYVVAVAHLNAFIFSQEDVPQEVEAARRSLLRKTHYLTDEVLRSHLLLYRLPQQHNPLGFSTYEQLPPLRARRLHVIAGNEERNEGDEG
ncbi:RNA polymerase II-associated protein 1 [Astyanax mexicanus]|uniref:RNA polymerase II-associated protein 1 n=1 Tax=Astyanax mexicanus TaxID=7994 RepID=UPI0020CB42C5|nr:RNA polymerase II-associated protein 1 [Astyanax mexicanus]